MSITTDVETRTIADECGRVCGLIAHGEHDRDFMEDILSSHLWEQRPLGGELNTGYYKWVPNRHEEPLDAPVLLYESNEDTPGSFYATYLDLRK